MTQDTMTGAGSALGAGDGCGGGDGHLWSDDENVLFHRDGRGTAGGAGNGRRGDGWGVGGSRGNGRDESFGYGSPAGRSEFGR